MAIPLALIGLKALVTLGTRLIGKKAVEAALNRGGKQALIKSVSRVQNKKPPVQKEMFNKSGTVKAGIKKSNELAAKAKEGNDIPVAAAAKFNNFNISSTKLLHSR